MGKYSNIEELKSVIASSFSIAEVCRKLNIIPSGGNYQTIHKLVNKYGLDVSHFKSEVWNKGLKMTTHKPKPLDDILKDNTNYSTSKLKKRLFDAGLKYPKCEQCGILNWNDKQLSFELHHINGNRFDNRLENLQILCPNCHSQTDTYRIAKSALPERARVESLKFKEVVHGNADNNLEPSTSQTKSDEACAETLQGKPKSKYTNKCICCGKPIRNSRKYCSVECYRTDNSRQRPDVFTLLKAFREHKTFTGVGRFFGVSNHAVKKWCVLYGILDMVEKKSRPQQ